MANQAHQCEELALICQSDATLTLRTAEPTRWRCRSAIVHWKSLDTDIHLKLTQSGPTPALSTLHLALADVMTLVVLLGKCRLTCRCTAHSRRRTSKKCLKSFIGLHRLHNQNITHTISAFYHLRYGTNFLCFQLPANSLINECILLSWFYEKSRLRGKHGAQL